MAKKSRLSLAFVSKRPAAAARVLESLSVDDATAYVENIPTRYAVKVLTPLDAVLATSIVRRLQPESATAVIREMKFAHACAVLRRLPEGLRLSILAELPARRRREFETALEFPADAVGANMSTAFVTASDNDTVAGALQRVSKDKDGDSGLIFIVDEQYRLLGSVPLGILARRRANTLLAELTDDTCPVISARARISQVMTLAAWDHHHELPVVSRQGVLIGVLARSVGVDNATVERPDTINDGQPVLELLLQMMAETATGLSRLVDPTRNPPAAAGERYER